MRSSLKASGACLLAFSAHTIVAEVPPDENGAPIEALKSLARRIMSFSVGAREFIACQLPPGTDLEILDTTLHDTPENWMDAIGIDETDRFAILKALFSQIAPTFRLRADPYVLATVTRFAALPDLPEGSAVLHLVEGLATGLMIVPARARLGEDDILLAPGATLLTAFIDRITNFLGVDSPGENLVALTFSKAPVAGPLLAITATGLVRFDLRIVSYPDLADLAKAAAEEPDWLPLLALAGSEKTAAALRRHALHGAHELPVKDPLSGFHLFLGASISMPHGLFVSGWYHDPQNRLEAIIAIDPDLENPEIMSNWMTFSGTAEIGSTMKPVIGFVAFLNRLEERAAWPDVRLRIDLEGGGSHMARALAIPPDPLAQRQAILETIAEHAFDETMLSRIYVPAIDPLQKRLNQAQSVREAVSYGRPSAKKVSLVIPLYAETGFIRSQLLAFSNDPWIRDTCEIVYVCDDPPIAQLLKHMLAGMTIIFPRLDIRLVILSVNGGYAAANNFGAQAAAGDYLVLMNSDVIPENPGWLETAIQKLETLPPFSVIGPKLLYADGALQHAGMNFDKLGSNAWQNPHRYKGYARNFPPANVDQNVPAVTGAAMILSRAEFLELGGFSQEYVVGDFEDSDLCLKLGERGGVCWYMASVALFHFERQSMPKSGLHSERGSSVYNRLLHTAKWSARIETIMKQALV